MNNLPESVNSVSVNLPVVGDYVYSGTHESVMSGLLFLAIAPFSFVVASAVSTIGRVFKDDPRTMGGGSKHMMLPTRVFKATSFMGAITVLGVAIPWNMLGDTGKIPVKTESAVYDPVAVTKEITKIIPQGYELLCADGKTNPTEVTESCGVKEVASRPDDQYGYRILHRKNTVENNKTSNAHNVNTGSNKPDYMLLAFTVDQPESKDAGVLTREHNVNTQLKYSTKPLKITESLTGEETRGLANDPAYSKLYGRDNIMGKVATDNKKTVENLPDTIRTAGSIIYLNESRSNVFNRTMDTYNKTVRDYVPGDDTNKTNDNVNKTNKTDKTDKVDKTNKTDNDTDAASNTNEKSNSSENNESNKSDSTNEDTPPIIDWIVKIIFGLVFLYFILIVILNVLELLS